ncbi:RHS repeat protein [Pectobacterium brasiliense]|nr:RHS repeat protein [Pectobacterium brasiliense]
MCHYHGVVVTLYFGYLFSRRGGSETRFGYDVEGNLTAVTDALGQRYQFRNGTCSTERKEEICLHRHLSSFLIITFLILIMFIYNSN